MFYDKSPRYERLIKAGYRLAREESGTTVNVHILTLNSTVVNKVFLLVYISTLLNAKTLKKST